jgi:hypothetical protein
MSTHDIKFIGAAKAQISDSNPEQAVRDAIALARSMVKDASEELNRIRQAGGGVGEDMAATRAAYYESRGRSFPIFFGWDDDNPEAMLRKIGLRLSEVYERIEKGLTVKCRPGSGRRSMKCSEGTTAFQVGGWALNPRTFNLCPKWFDKDDVHRAAILVHELCHAIGGPGGRTDQKGISGNTVYGLPRALTYAHLEPDRACFSAENFEQFLIYREEIKDPANFPVTGSSGWVGVPAHMDAAVQHPNGKYYFFKGGTYWRYDPGVNKVDKVGVIGRDGWSGVPHDLDAALVHPRNGKIYLFKDDRYWRFDPTPGIDKVDHADVRIIGASGWTGLKAGIDAAFTHPSGRAATFFYGPNVAIFNFDRDAVVAWRFVRDYGYDGAYGTLNAAVHVPGLKNAYFFTAGHYQRHPLT